MQDDGYLQERRTADRIRHRARDAVSLEINDNMASSPAEQPSLKQIAQTLFDDALHNIMHSIVIDRHRDHKLMIQNLDPTDKLPHCDTCKLPRLLDPPLAPKVRGATSDPPANTQYCDRKPWSRRPGHDIYDNPFPRSDITGRPPTKKEREAAKNSKKDDNTPASEDATQNGTAPPSPSARDDDNGPPGKDRPLEKGEKKASKIDEKLKKGEYVPWHTCPSCKRSLLITRFAKHLEQCMGLSGRAASRNAMAKMNGTPSGSRGGTPNPSQEGDNGEEDEDRTAGGNIKKKLLKKGLDKKLKKEKEKGGAGTTGKLPKGANKKTPVRSSPAPSSVGGEGKREREDAEDEDDEVHVKKRQKMQRVGSTASFTSSVGGGGGGAALERTESMDGSFVDEGSVAED